MASSDESANIYHQMGELQGDPDEDNQLFKQESILDLINEEQKPVPGYIRLDQNQDFQFQNTQDNKENMLPQDNFNQQDDPIDEFLGITTKKSNSHFTKKQIPLEEALKLVEQKLSEKSTIENRINGLKFLSQKLKEARPNTEKANILCNWFEAMRITDKFLHEDSHPQILKNMNSIIKYLYENQKLSEQWIVNFAESGMHSSHEQYLKVLQSLVSLLKMQHLKSIFELICQKGNIEESNIGGLLNNIVSNKYFSQQIKPVESQKKSKAQQKISILEQFQNMQNPQNRQYEQQFERKSEGEQVSNEKQSTRTKELALRLFKFLIEVTEKHEKLDKNQKNDKVGYNYYQILNKLVYAKHEFLSNQLSTTLPDLLKTGKINSVWILQTCLKIDFGSNNKQKNSKTQGKFSFIIKLANENLYEYLLIIMAKCRLFNKTIVDKILNILILLSKNYKPLDEAYTQFIWKILGLNSREQKQRQQFFIFVKDILRNQSNFTEEAVYFIFFEILMSLSAEWFSLKILDCLEMLFMRLNQDLKLISYADQTYSIQDPDLVGIDKFWYIYFYSNDSKVTKKCKDMLWKLATYNSTSQIKIRLLKEYVQKITKQMCSGPEQMRIDFCNKGFDIIDKMMEQVQKKQITLTQEVEINLMNECRDALAPKKVTLRLSQKCTLQFLRQQITQAITPSNNNIKLLSRGQFLKGQRMTLKDLGIENKNTITVIDDQPATKLKEQKVSEMNNNILKQLSQIFGSELSHDLLKFIVQKMEGQNLQRITDAIMDTDKLERMTIEFQELNPKDDHLNKISAVHFDEQQKQQQMNLINDSVSKENKLEALENPPKEEKMENQPEQLDQQLPKFSNILTSSQNYINQILFCASEGSKKRGWTTIKNLPKPSFVLAQIRRRCEEQNWEVLFPKQEANQMICTYNAHLLKCILTSDKTKIEKYMLERGGFAYLIDWLRRIPEGSSNIVLEEVTNLLVIVLEQNCSALTKFRDRVHKKEQKMLLSQLFEQNFLQIQSKNDSFVKYEDESFFSWLINLLLSAQKVNNNSSFPSQNIAEIILCFILGSNERLQNVLELPLSEIFYIIQNHGFVGQYIFLTSMSKVLGDNFKEEKRLQYSRKFLQLANFGFNYNILQEKKSNIIYLYDIIACVMDKITEHTEIETQITLKCIESIKTQSQFIQADHLIAILELLKLCLKLCKKNGNIGAKEKIQSTTFQFSYWLFKEYLFDLEKPRKHIRNKSVRKVCYEILQNIAQSNEQVAKILVEEIVEIQIKQRNKDEDYIDFRSQNYVGLNNLGATCYINSLLQQIYHTKFSKLLLQKGDKEPQHTERMKQLKHIFMQMCYSIKNSVNPKQFIKNIEFYGQPINTSVQQDASQFLLCLFDYIEGQGCQQEVYKVFGGYLCNQITILDEQIEEQQLVKENIQHFNSLTIDIKGKKNLQEALAYLIKPQILDGQNMYFCDELGKKTKASKRCYIQKMPNILILTLKRFQYDLDSHTRHKLNDYFEFPFQLDMHKYSSSYLRLKEESSPDSKYKLAGMLVHSGSAESGHYYSYIKIGEQWFEFNDKVVSQFNIQNNLKNECFGCPEGRKTRSAYMLFYQKVQTTFHGVSLNQIPETNAYKRAINEQNAVFLKTRLIYDDNYKNLLEELKELTFEPKLTKYIENIFGKKITIISQEKKEQMIYFDIDANDDENKKLLDSYLDLEI